MVVRLGEYDRGAVEAPERLDLDVDQTFVPPDFINSRKYNDIGLIRMVRSVQFNQYIRPACLSNTFEAETTRAKLTGWGKTSILGESTKLLTKIAVDLQSHDECSRHFKSKFNSSSLRHGIIEDTQLCGRTIYEQACAVRNTIRVYEEPSFLRLCVFLQGFAGAPLQIEHPSIACAYAIVGTTSFSVCQTDDHTGVYTRVFGFLDWIEAIVWNGSVPDLVTYSDSLKFGHAVPLAFNEIDPLAFW